MSVASLSKRTGITTSSIYSMLGNDDIKLQTLLRFLQELDTSLHAFVYGDEPAPSDFEILQTKYDSSVRELTAMRDHVETLKLTLQQRLGVRT